MLHKVRSGLHLVARVGNLLKRQEFLLDRPHADEAADQVGAASLVVGARSTSATKRLLADDGTGALAVDIEVTSRVPEGLLGEADGFPVLSEDGAGKGVGGSPVDSLANLREGIGGSIIVDVSDEDRAEELAAEERVGGVASSVNGRVDEVALATVVLAADEQLQFGVVLGLINDAGQLLERSLVDDGAAEVGEIGGVTDLQSRGLSDENFLESGPKGLGDVDAGGSAALLALVFESTTHGLLGSVLDVGRGVNQVEVLATSLTNDARVALVGAIGNSRGNLTIQAAEDLSATGEVEGSEFSVAKNDLGDFLGVAGHELNDVRGQASLEQNLVEKPVRGHGGGRRLPDDNVAHQCRSAGKVTGNGGEVERSDGVDETL